jgi:hypothetical protein
VNGSPWGSEDRPSGAMPLMPVAPPVRSSVLSGSMPRWFFLLFAIALGLSVMGGVLIFLRSPTPIEQPSN